MIFYNADFQRITRTDLADKNRVKKLARSWNKDRSDSMTTAVWLCNNRHQSRCEECLPVNDVPDSIRLRPFRNSTGGSL